VRVPFREAERSLKPKWFWGIVSLEYVRFRLGEEEILFKDEGDEALAEERDPIGRIIQERLKRELKRAEQMRESPLDENLPRMMTLPKAFAQNKKPFWELARKELRALNNT
jgi:hypothetical protein